MYVNISTDFGWALDRLRAWGRVQRSGWNGKGMWIAIFRAEDWRDAASRAEVGGASALMGGAHETAPFIVMRTADRKLIPWTPSQTDILATDWLEVAP